MSFAGRTVLITGAGGGIGRAAAGLFHARGANVVLVDVDEALLEASAKELELDPTTSLLVPADVRHEANVAGYVSATLERFGAIDVFFNNAGVEGGTGPLVETTDATLDAILDVNIRGVFYGLKHVIPVMTAAGGGAIVNTSSMAGKIGFTGLGVYTASKHAVIGLTRVAALESAAAGIRVNAVCPGPVNTRMMRGIESGFSPEDPEAVKAQFADLPAIKRYAEPEEVATLVAFLASDEASYITGSSYEVDGGMSA